MIHLCLLTWALGWQLEGAGGAGQVRRWPGWQVPGAAEGVRRPVGRPWARDTAVLHCDGMGYGDPITPAYRAENHHPID